MEPRVSVQVTEALQDELQELHGACQAMRSSNQVLYLQHACSDHLMRSGYLHAVVLPRDAATNLRAQLPTGSLAISVC